MGESSLEVVDSDIVLDRLELGNQLDLRLDQSSQLLLGEPGQLANYSQVLVDNGDLGVADLDVWLDEGAQLPLGLVPEAFFCRRHISFH